MATLLLLKINLKNYSNKYNTEKNKISMVKRLKRNLSL